MALAVLAAGGAAAQESGAKHEIGLTLGRIGGAHREGTSSRLDLGSGIALQANYGYRLLQGHHAAL